MIPPFNRDEAALPPGSTPFAASFPLLKKAASEGNAMAACRLVENTMRCRRTRAMKELADASIRFSDELMPEDADQMDVLAGVIERRVAELPPFLVDAANSLTAAKMDHSIVHAYEGASASDIAFCEGAIDPSNRDVRAWIRDAALRGEPLSMRLYASGLMWSLAAGDLEGLGTGMAAVDAPEHRRWMAEAPVVLDAAIARGDRHALLIALAAAHGETALTPALPVDDRRDAILAALALRLEGREPVPSTAELGLPPDLAVAADAEAEALYRRAFAGRGDGVWSTLDARAATGLGMECGE